MAMLILIIPNVPTGVVGAKLTVLSGFIETAKGSVHVRHCNMLICNLMCMSSYLSASILRQLLHSVLQRLQMWKRL